MESAEVRRLRAEVESLLRQVSELKASELALVRILNELCAVVPANAAAILAKYEGYRDDIKRIVHAKLGDTQPGVAKEPGALPARRVSPPAG